MKKKGDDMPKHKTLPEFNNYEQCAEWLDNHSTGNLETSEVYFELAPPLTIRIVDSLGEIEEAIIVEKELSQQILKIARRQGLSAHDLVHEWLKEKVKINLN
jgi:hypothetical protein